MVILDTVTPAHKELAGYPATPLENWFPKPQCFKSVQYCSNIRSELKALVEGLQYYALPLFCFCIIIQVMTLCKRVHSEMEILGRNVLYFLNQLEKEVMRNQDSAPFSPISAESYKTLDQLLLAGCIPVHRHLPKSPWKLLINTSLSIHPLYKAENISGVFFFCASDPVSCHGRLRLLIYVLPSFE